MIISKKHVGAEGGGEVVPSLYRLRGFLGGGPPQVGKGGESEEPFCCRHSQGTLCARANSGRESPEVFGMGESTTPILTSGGCQGDPPTNQGLEAKSRIQSILPDDTNRASSLPTEDPHST